MLHVRDGVPDGFLEVSPRRLHEILPGPTLMFIEGEREPPLFVSVLLHGNEPAGLYAIQRVLSAHRGARPPRSLLLFVGNVLAAREGVRRLDGQPDYNRIWLPGETPEHAMTARVLSEVLAHRPFASVDVHNNSGRNPHYACVNDLSAGSLHLASLFDERAIYATTPAGVLTAAMRGTCPAVTLECGDPDDAAGVRHAARFLEDVLAREQLPDGGARPAALRLYESAAVLHVPEAVSFGFDEDADVVFPSDLDVLNFQELPPGLPMARVRPGLLRPVVALSPAGEDLTDHFFVVEDSEVRTRTTLVPSMLTLDSRVIRQDCLGYLLVPRAVS